MRGPVAQPPPFCRRIHVPTRPWPCRYERGQLGGRAKSQQYDGVTLELGEASAPPSTPLPRLLRRSTHPPPFSLPPCRRLHHLAQELPHEGLGGSGGAGG